jgi:hypothetical protein
MSVVINNDVFCCRYHELERQKVYVFEIKSLETPSQEYLNLLCQSFELITSNTATDCSIILDTTPMDSNLMLVTQILQLSMQRFTNLTRGRLAKFILVTASSIIRTTAITVMSLRGTSSFMHICQTQDQAMQLL